MAFNPAPQTWLGAGYTLASSNVKLTTQTAGSNIALPELTDTEANATTGDIRKVAFAIAEALFAAWSAQGEGNQPLEMTLQKAVSPLSGGTQLQLVYTSTFVVDVTGQEVADEP